MLVDNNWFYNKGFIENGWLINGGRVYNEKYPNDYIDEELRGKPKYRYLIEEFKENMLLEISQLN